RRHDRAALAHQAERAKAPCDPGGPDCSGASLPDRCRRPAPGGWQDRSEPMIDAPQILDTPRLRRQGVMLFTIAHGASSTAGFFVRLIGLDSWTILFWRGIFAGVIVACVAWHQRRGPPWPIWARMGWPGWIVAAMSSLSMLAFVTSLSLTTVAD